jgi:hypothetical protein
MDTKDARQERRRSTRISPKGTVLLVAGEHTERGRIANLGRHGLLMITDATAAEQVLDRPVEIELRLDDGRSEWLRLSGRALRIEATSIAVSFDDAPAELARLIEETSTASYAHQRIMSVVLIDATANRRGSIAEAFRAVGCDVIDVSTPLEAIVRLGESRFEPDLIAIADSIPSSTSEDLRRFVEREHPDAKLVTIGDDLVEPTGLAHWLSAADPESDLSARVLELLGRSSR